MPRQVTSVCDILGLYRSVRHRGFHQLGMQLMCFLCVSKDPV